MKKSQANQHTTAPMAQSINLWSLITAVGLRILIPVVVCVLVGIKIDKTFHTLPLATVTSIILSFAISIVLLIRFIRSVQ